LEARGGGSIPPTLTKIAVDFCVWRCYINYIEGDKR